MAWLEAQADGLCLTVKVTPRAKRAGILGITDRADGGQVLKIGVGAAPADGKANAALIKLLAKECRLARSDISLIAGQTSRTKRLHIKGHPTALEQVIRSAIHTAGLAGP